MKKIQKRYFLVNTADAMHRGIRYVIRANGDIITIPREGNTYISGKINK